MLALDRQRIPSFLALSIGGAGAYLLVVGVVPALLVGPLVAASVVPIAPRACTVTHRTTMAGGVLSFLAVGCPLCNKLVVLALGASGALTFFEPVQPLLGLVSVWLRLGPPAAPSAARWRQARAPFGD